MITLAMDTSHKHLAVALIKDNKIINKYCELCPKKQSEYLMPVIDSLCKEANVKPLAIDSVVCSIGPGSYTGVRIALTSAKVICALRNIPLYTISTLDLLSDDNCAVILDARSNRAYYGIYKNGQLVDDINVDTLENISKLIEENKIIGDASLFGKEDNYPDIADNFLKHQDKWHLEKNVDTVVPLYLKDAQSYMVKK